MRLPSVRSSMDICNVLRSIGSEMTALKCMLSEVSVDSPLLGCSGSVEAVSTYVVRMVRCVAVSSHSFDVAAWTMKPNACVDGFHGAGSMAPSFTKNVV